MKIGSESTLKRLHHFQLALAKLCNQYAFDLTHDTSTICVLDRDDDRSREQKLDWPAVASFLGVRNFEIEEYGEQYLEELKRATTR